MLQIDCMAVTLAVSFDAQGHASPIIPNRRTPPDVPETVVFRHLLITETEVCLAPSEIDQ
jgi:hypothetical protein